MDKSNELLGKYIKARRKLLGLTQEKVAEKSGISHVYYGEIERGDKSPALSTLYSICDTLDCPPGDLLNGQLHESSGYMDSEKSKELLLKEITDMLEKSSLKDLKQYHDILQILIKDKFVE